MNFSQEPEQEVVDEAESLATPAYGGKWHLIGYGILVPLGICYFAYRAWVDRDALWISQEGISDFRLKGEAARVMAAAYLCGAAFMHFRWFWGLLGFEKTSHTGVLLALYYGIGAMLTALGFAIAGE